MDVAELKKLLGLDADCDEATLVAKLQEVKGGYDQRMDEFRKAKAENDAAACEKLAGQIEGDFKAPLQAFEKFLTSVPEEKRAGYLNAFQIDEPDSDPAHYAAKSLQSPEGRKAILLDTIDRKGADDATVALQDAHDRVYMLSAITRKDPRTLKAWGEYDHMLRSHPLTKALYSTGSGLGDELVPTELSAQIIEKMALDAVVNAIHGPFIDMPTNPYDIPALTGRMTIYKVPEASADTPVAIPASDPTTTKRTITAYKFAGRVPLSEELTEDSVAPIIPMLQADAALSMNEHLDDALINGDTAATHMDSNVTSVMSHLKAWLGYRAKAVDESLTTDISTITTAKCLSVMVDGGIYMARNRRNTVVWITSTSGEGKLLGLTELVTVDKYGPAATILTGEVGRLFGAPVIVSGQVYENLNDTGVYDGSTVDQTVLLCVYRGGFAIGRRRGIRVRVVENQEAEAFSLLISARFGLLDKYGSGAKSATMGVHMLD